MPVKLLGYLRWLAPPEGDADYNGRRARTIHIISLAVLMAGSLALLILVLDKGLPRSLFPLTMGVILSGLAFLLNRWGKLLLAGMVLIFDLIAILTWLLFIGQGIHDIAVTLYPVVMIVIALLARDKIAWIGYGLVFASVGIVVGGEIVGFLQTGLPENITSLTDFFLVSIIIGVTGVGLSLVNNYLYRDLTRAQEAVQALQASEARFRSLAENAPSLIANIDRSGTIRYLNASDLGKRESLLGRSMLNFFPPEAKVAAKHILESVFDTGAAQMFEGQLLSAAGDRSWHQIHLGPVWEEGKVASLVLIANNVQELKNASESLQQRSHQLAAINQIAGSISRLQSPESVLSEVLSQIRAVLSLDTFFVGFYQAETNTIQFPLMYDSGKYFTPEPVQIHPESWTYQCVHEEKPILFLRTVEQMKAARTETRIGDPERVSASIMMVPLKIGERCIGVVSVQSYTMNAYTQEHLEFLCSAANQIAISLENARLYSELQKELAERQRSEAALRKSEARLRSLVENLPFDLWMCDSEGRFTFQSAVSQRLVGHVIGKHPSELNLPQATIQRWLSLHQRAMDGQIVLEESKVEQQNELHEIVTMLAPMRDEETMIGFVGINIDVTDLKRSEEAVRRYADRIEILHQIDQAILAVHSPQEIALAALSRLHRLVPCSSASLALLDVEKLTAQIVATYADEKTFSGTMELIPFQDPDRLEMLLAGEVVYITDLVTQPLEGPPSLNRVLLQGPIHAVIAVPLCHQEKLVGVLSVGAEKRGQLSSENVQVVQEIATQLAISIYQAQLTADIQQLNVELEQRVVDRTAQLEAAYKEMEAFSYSVSHDLRAPLRGITGYMKLLLDDYGEAFEAEAKDYLEKIDASARRMNQLIDDLLTLSRVGRQKLHRTQFKMGDLVSQVLGEILAGRDRERIKVTLYPMPGVYADLSLLRQVLQNLIDNAIKYSQTKPVAEIEIGSYLQGEETVFYVRDNGVGFDMSYAGKLFLPFERLHAQDEFEGTGIGLAIVRRILQRHGGRIWFEATPGEGATFYFMIGLAG